MSGDGGLQVSPRLARPHSQAVSALHPLPLRASTCALLPHLHLRGLQSFFSSIIPTNNQGEELIILYAVNCSSEIDQAGILYKIISTVIIWWKTGG